MPRTVAIVHCRAPSWPASCAGHRRWLPDPLASLWHEQHSGVPLQLQLEMRSADSETARLAAGRKAGGAGKPGERGQACPFE